MPHPPAVGTLPEVLAQTVEIPGSRAVRVVGRHRVGRLFQRRKAILDVGAHEISDAASALCLDSGSHINQDEGTDPGSRFLAYGRQQRDAAERRPHRGRWRGHAVDEPAGVFGVGVGGVVALCGPIAVTVASEVERPGPPASVGEGLGRGSPGVAGLAASVEENDGRPVGRAVDVAAQADAMRSFSFNGCRHLGHDQQVNPVGQEFVLRGRPPGPVVYWRGRLGAWTVTRRDETRPLAAVSKGAAAATIGLTRNNLPPTNEGTPLMPRGSDGAAQSLRTAGRSGGGEVRLIGIELPALTTVPGGEPYADRFDAASWTDGVGPTISIGPSDGGFTDEELTALALAADPDQPVDTGARPLDLYSGRSGNFLPMWYMPPVMMRGSHGWRTGVIVAIVAGFLLINALGLCITYGQLGAA